MKSILQPAYIQSYKNNKYDDSYRHSVFKVEKYEPLHLTGQVQQKEQSTVNDIEIYELLEEERGSDL